MGTFLVDTFFFLGVCFFFLVLVVQIVRAWHFRTVTERKIQNTFQPTNEKNPQTGGRINIFACDCKKNRLEDHPYWVCYDILMSSIDYGHGGVVYYNQEEAFFVTTNGYNERSDAILPLCQKLLR